MTAVASAAVLAAATVMMLGLEFLRGSVAHELHISGIAHRLTSQLVVEVHGDLVVGDLGHDALHAHAVLGHHGHDGAHADVLVVKLAVNVENLLLEFINHAGILGTEGLFGFQGEIKFLALFKVDDMILEALDERHIQPEDKGIGVLLVELEHTDLFITIYHKNLVNELNIFTCLNFLH